MFKRLNRLSSSLDSITLVRTAILFLVKKLTFQKARISFSQNGEDILLQSILNVNTGGFYVDIGCHFPVARSNTFNLYLKGWRGICVDANLDLIREFKKVRKSDIVENYAISNAEGELDFFEFHDPAIGTVSKAQKEMVIDHKSFKSVKKVKSLTLTKLLDLHSCPNKFELLSIDVEGHDFEVLSSLDFSKYQPEIILIEIGKQSDLKDIFEFEIFGFLTKRGYHFIAFDGMNAYFKKSVT